MKLTGAQIVIEVLKEHGVDTVFGYPGGTALNIYDELYKNSDSIHHVLTADEQGAAYAADGYSRATGHPGVVMSTSGPGATNLVTGLAASFMDSIPVVAITANVPDYMIGKDSFQEISIVGVTMPITKHNFFVNRPDELADTLRSAFRIAMSGRRGPVLVDITKDVTAASIEFESTGPMPLKPLPVISEESVEAAVRMIDEAEKPVLYIGGGVTASGAGKEIVELSEKADIPIVHSLMASDAVSCDYELNLGMLGMHGFIAANRAVDQADLIVALGARFSDRSSPNMSKWGRRARKLQIDVDRSEVDKNIMVDKAVIGDARDFLIRALPRVSSARHPEWHKRVLNWKAKGIVNEVVESTLHPRDIMENISSMTRGDAIFVTDVGQHQMWAAQYLRIGEGNRFITSGGLGAMGYGYGASIGAKLGCPDRQVIHITGDGSFHMNLNEVLTAVEQKLPIITVILNNETLGMVYQLQTTFCESRYSNTIHHRKMDYVKVAEGFGIKGYSVSDVKGFRDAFSKALEEDGPVWIECTISRFEKVLPFIPGGKTVDDMILY